MRDLNRGTAKALDALERGETFEIRRRGKSIGYLNTKAPLPRQNPNWKEHFDWLRKQPKGPGKALLKEFEASRRRQRRRENILTGQLVNFSHRCQ